MNKKFNIFLMIAFFIAAIVFALSAAGHESEYLKNYSKNFKTNLYAFSIKFGLPQNIVQSVPTPNPADLFTPTPAPTITPAPPFTPTKPADTSAIEETSTVTLQNAANMKFVLCNDYLVGADTVTIKFYNKKGEEEHSGSVQLSSPLLRTEGKYIVAADKGGKKVYLFNEKKQLFEINTESNIVSADVSDNGDIVLVCEKDYYKGCVVVYNKNGELVYAWNSGSDRIIDADISGQSRRLAILTMNLDSDNVTSNILWCDIDKEENGISSQYQGTLMYDVEFTGNQLFVLGDDKLAGTDSDGKTSWEYEYNGTELKRYDCSEMISGVFDINNLPYIETYNIKGDKKGALKLNVQSDHIDLNDTTVAYNDERTLFITDIEGKTPKSFSCMRDIEDIIIMEKDIIAVVYSSSVEFVKLK